MAAEIQFCNMVENRQGVMCLNGLQHMFYLDEIPGAFSFGLFITLTEHDWNALHRFRIELQGPDRSILFAAEDTLPKVEFDERIPERFRAVIGAWQILNMRVPAEGVYKARVYVDGILDGEKELFFLRQAREY